MKGFPLVLAVVAMAALALMVLAAAVTAQTAAAQREYENRLATLEAGNVDQAYELAKWCYQNEMLNEAEKHTREALAEAKEDARLRYLLYLLVGAEEDQAESGEGAPGVIAAVAVSDEEIKEIWERETPKVMQAFRDFQGTLISRCASPRCHGGGNAEAKFVLVRSATTSERTMAQNFVAIQPYLNRTSPEESRILSIPMGGKETGHPQKSIRTQNDAVYRAGVKWIDMLLTDTERIFNKGAGGEGGAVFDNN